MDWLNWTLVTLHTCAGFATAGHALLHKRDPRAALGWIAVCLTFPFAGPLLYFLFGINRVRTRARELNQRSRFGLHAGYEPIGNTITPSPGQLPIPSHFKELTRVSGAVTERPLTWGNQIEPLHNGEQTYPAMLEAIEGAQQRLFLSSYIFETNNTGQQFIHALGRATQRDVDVRVIVDGIGEWYSLPRASTLLKDQGLRVARFLPPSLLPPSLHINLRNHRKILVADGCIGFAGGINIGDRHLAERQNNTSRVVDMHFRLTGPIVAEIEQVFLSDWSFVTGEPPAPLSQSIHNVIGANAICRTIVDGPNEDLGKLATILVGAIALARRKISIMTPYFLPFQALIAALQAAALRGVEVIIILPAQSNLPYVHWATRNMLWQLLRWDVQIYYQPPPFAHTKLFLVDEHYVQIGSANLDPRSLRLNFELAIEVYDKSLSQSLTAYMDTIRKRSQAITLEDLDNRPLWIQARDALAWLFSPYL
jgi:cardiolipin synthase